MKLKLKSRVNPVGLMKLFTRKVGESIWDLQREEHNIVVNLGRNLIRDNTFGTQSFSVIRGAVSDDGDTPIATDTSLGSNEVRVAFQAGNPDNTTNYQSTIEYFVDGTQWAAASPGAMTEVQKAGLYYKAAGSFLYNAASFTSVAVDTDTEMLVQWIVSFNDA